MKFMSSSAHSTTNDFRVFKERYVLMTIKYDNLTRCFGTRTVSLIIEKTSRELINDQDFSITREGKFVHLMGKSNSKHAIPIKPILYYRCI